MEQGVWQEIELLYQKFQKLGTVSYTHLIKNVLIYFSSKIRAKIGIYSSNLVRMR